MNKWEKAGIYTLLVQLTAYYFISFSPNFIDQYIIPYVFYPVSALLRFFSRWLPFSFGLILIFILSLWLLYKLIFSLRAIFRKQKSFKAFLTQTLAGLSPVLFIYMITWGFLYYRSPITHHMQLDTSEIELSELILLTEDLTSAANQLRSEIKTESFENLNFEEVERIAAGSFEFLPKNYRSNQNLFAKKAAGSTLLAYMGTAGIYTFWTGEANVNKILVPQDVPDVMLHEMAHQLGVASEDEASFVAWLAGKDHEDKVFRYSVTSKLLWRSLGQLYSMDSTSAAHIASQIDSIVVEDQFQSAASWEPYHNLIGENVVRPIYSFFLRANGEEEGIYSYNRIVDLAIFERRPRLEK